MSEDEQIAWCQQLGRTVDAQATTLRELLRHAGEDEMSSEDRTICRRQLSRLTDAQHRWWRGDRRRA
jgi:hypothetical protein